MNTLNPTTPNPQTFAEVRAFILHLRKEQEASYPMLSETLGVSKSTLARIINGQKVRENVVARMANNIRKMLVKSERAIKTAPRAAAKVARASKKDSVPVSTGAFAALSDEELDTLMVLTLQRIQARRMN